MSGACLIRRDFLNVSRCDDMSNPTVIYLNKNKITVGRSKFNDCRIMSRRVSNNQAIITQGSNSKKWLIESLDGKFGTFINGYKVKNNVQFLVKNRDLICFGEVIPKPDDEINVFVCCFPPTNLLQPSSLITTNVRTSALADKIKKQPTQHNVEGIKGVGPKTTETQIEAEQQKRIKALELELKHEKVFTSGMKKNVEMLEARINKLTKESEEKIRNEQDEVKTTKERLRSALDEKTRLSEFLNNWLQEQELRDRETIVEKSKISSALRFSSLINDILQELVESEGPQDGSVTTTTGFASIVTSVLEAELKCGICSEVVIEALTLECSHIFCSYCISVRKETSNDCPICTRPFQIFTKMLVLDSFIDKLMDLMSPTLKMQRSKTIFDRKLLKKPIEKQNVPFFNFPFLKKLTSDSSVDEKLRPQLIDHLKKWLHVKKQQDKETTIGIDKEETVGKKKLEWALHYSYISKKILQELVAPRGFGCSQSSENAYDLSVTLTTVLESELNCGICTELVIEAVTLECSHMFCCMCINEWSKLKKDCPICRNPVVMFTKALALDSFIDKIFDLLSPGLKQMRLEVIDERKLTNRTVERQGSPNYGLQARSNPWML